MRSNSVIYIFAFLLKKQILSFKSNSQFGRTVSTREANRKSRMLFPVVKNMDKHEGVSINLIPYLSGYKTGVLSL